MYLLEHNTLFQTTVHNDLTRPVKIGKRELDVRDLKLCNVSRLGLRLGQMRSSLLPRRNSEGENLGKGIEKASKLGLGNKAVAKEVRAPPRVSLPFLPLPFIDQSNERFILSILSRLSRPRNGASYDSTFIYRHRTA